LGRQAHHVSELWTEIGEKQTALQNQAAEIRRLKDMIARYRRKLYTDKLDQAEIEKSFKEFVGESVDN
jgi:chorismate mutase